MIIFMVLFLIKYEGGVEGMYMSVDANQTRRGHWILGAGGTGSCEQDGVLGTEF